MLEEVLSYLNNWFVTEIQSGTFTIQDGSIALSFLQNGQYFRIVGSVFNDGVYKYGDEELKLVDETFDGAIWAMAIPRMLLDLVDEIKSWQAKYGDSVSGPYTSESFGGYSYSKGNSNSSGNEGSSWKTYFKDRLKPYRKLRDVSAVQPTREQHPPYRRPFNPNYPFGG